jgi:hypothetical protein
VHQEKFQKAKPKLAVIVTVENIRIKLESLYVKHVTKEHTLPKIHIGTSAKIVRKVSFNQVQGKPVVQHVTKANTWLLRESTKNARCVRRESMLTRRKPLAVLDVIRINFNQILAKQSVRLVLLASSQKAPQN